MAFAIASPALLVALVVVIAALAFLASLDAEGGEGTQAGLARIGDAVALLIVTDESGAATAAAARDFIIDWGLLAPALALIPALGASWLAAGRVQGTLRRARAEVEAAEHEREKGLQEVVHELRTPLAVMGTNLELATSSVGESTPELGYIDAARRAVDRMARTVNDLEGHGGLTIEQADGPLDVALLAEAVVAEHVGPCRARGVHLLIDGSSSIMVPGVDPAAVRTVIGNFLSNAVKMAPKGSAVTVDRGTSDDWAWVAVIDEGPGLPSHHHARAFERGWQGSHGRDRDDGGGGAGLGLTIARQLTEAQGGVVTIESDEGGGATFVLWLPLRLDVPPSVVVAPDGVHSLIRPWRRDLQPA